MAISGNHDREALFGLLRHAQELTSPMSPGTCPPGRLYLAAQPGTLKLADAQGRTVQFALLPYPTAYGYDVTARFSTLAERNRMLHQAMLDRLRAMQEHEIDPRLPAVLCAHAHVRGASMHNLYRISEQEDVVFEEQDIVTGAGGWAYAAYGHIHKPQALCGTTHVRYSGSIERLDLAEQHDDKSAVLVEIGDRGRLGEPALLPLSATPIYKLEIHDPDTELEGLAERYPQAQRALTYYRVHYQPGRHNREEIRRQMERVFPPQRSCQREIVPVAESLPEAAGSVALPDRERNVADTVRGYLQEQLQAHKDRQEILGLLEQLLLEDTAAPASPASGVAA